MARAIRHPWLCLGLAACSSNACEEKAGPDPRALILGTTIEPETIDPAFAQLAGAQEVSALLFRDLTARDAAWKLVPSLADGLPEIETSTAGPIVHWRLKKDLRWSDGHPLTTEDLLFGHRVEADPRLSAVSHAVAVKVKRMTSTSSLALDVVWSVPYADYRAPRVHAILPAHAYPPIEGAPSFRGLGRTTVSSGPFRLTEWIAGRSLTVEPNPHWRGPAPYFRKIVVRFYTSEEALEAGLLAGDVEGTLGGAGLSLERADALAARLASTHVLDSVASGAWLHLEARLDDPVVGQLPIRQAIDRAIDRRVLAKLVYGDHGAPASAIFPPRHPAHTHRGAAVPSASIAKDLVAGVARTPLAPITLQYGAGNPGAERAAAYLEQTLGAIGLPIKLEPLPVKVLLARLEARSQAPLVLFNWRARPDWDGRSLFHSSGRQNVMGYRSTIVDERLDAAEGALDPARWAALVAQVEAQALQDLPVIPLAFRDEVALRPRRLLGVELTGAGPTTWNVEAWRRDTPPGP